MTFRIIALAAAIAIATFAVYAALKPGAAPEVGFATLAGETLSTSQLRGKVVLVSFWATYCPDCLREMPAMIESYRRYAPRGFEVVAVAVRGDNPAAVADFATRRALPFKVALDASGEIARGFGNVRLTPTSFLIDRDGRIVARYVGAPAWPDFHAAIENAL